MAETFVELIAELKTDDKKLVDGMRKAEKTVTDSSRKMQNSLNAVNKSSIDVGTSMGAAGQVAAAAGGQFGGMAGQVLAAGQAIKALGVGIFGLPGLLIAAGAAAVALAINYFEAAEAADELAKKQKELNKELRETASKQRAAALASGASTITGLVAANKTNLQKAKGRLSSAVKERGEVGLSTRSFRRVTELTGTNAELKAFQDKRKKQLDEIIELEAANIKKLEKIRRDERVKTELQIAKTARSFMAGLIKQANDVIKARAAATLSTIQGALIATGGAKLSEFIADPTQKRVQELLEKRDAGLGGTTPAQSFSTGTRSAAQFRFGGTGATIGTQKETVTEQKKSNGLLKDIRKELRALLVEAQSAGLN